MLLLSVIKGDGERRQFLGMCVLEDENLLQILFTLRRRTREGISFVVVSIKFITDVFRTAIHHKLVGITVSTWQIIIITFY